MAASIRQQMLVKNNVLTLLNFAKLRCRSELINTERIVRTRHWKKSPQISRFRSSKSPPRKSVNGEVDDLSLRPAATSVSENEDFFGIPDSYKLQHSRIGSSLNTSEAQARSEENQASQQFGEALENLKNHVTADNRLTASHSQRVHQSRSRSRSRHNRRKDKTMAADFLTSFGGVSFDRTAYLKADRNIDILATKAKHIFETSNTSSLREPTRKRRSKPTEYVTDENTNHNIFDEQYFGTAVYDEKASSNTKSYVKGHFANSKSEVISNIDFEDISRHVENVRTNPYSNQQPKSKTDTNFFDEQYFDNLLKEESNEGRPKSQRAVSAQSTQVNEELNEVDQQYFGGSISAFQSTSENPSSLEAVAEQYLNLENSVSDIETMPGNMAEFQNAKERGKKYTQHSSSISSQSNSDSSQIIENNSKSDFSSVAMDNTKSVHKEALNEEKRATDVAITNESFLKRQEQRQKAYVSKVQSQDSGSDSAFDFALKVRHSLQAGQKDPVGLSDFKIPEAYNTAIEENDGLEMVGKRCRFDSKGYRILDRQVPDFDKLTSSDAIRMLKSRIIFNHDDFLAIDKPYGMPSVGQQHDRLSVSSLLPALVSSLPHSFKASELHIVQGLDRDVTGAIILAKSSEVAHDLKLMYSDSDRCIQRFWTLTKGVPKPPQGIVDIPIGEGRVAGRYKRMLRPLYRPNFHPGMKLSKAPSEAATTEYKVLSRNMTAALLECTPLTNGVKHQVRVHLAYGLNSPILGDHKYSHFAKLAPQKLDVNTLALLKIRQSKVRHLSLHLHLRSVILTNYKGRMIFLTTRPPTHFVDNLRSLKLQMPKK